MAEQKQQTRETGRWLRWSIPEDELERILAHAEDFEHTQIRYLWALVLGTVAGAGIAVGLLLASL